MPTLTKESRSATTASLRKLTSEQYMPAVGAYREQHDGIDWKTVVPVVTVIAMCGAIWAGVAGSVYHQKSTEAKYDATTNHIAVTAAPPPVLPPIAVPEWREPKRSIVAEIGVAAQAEIRKQITLSHQLARAGKFEMAATTLVDACSKYSTDVALRIAAIRAQLRIQNYAAARKLCLDGIKLAKKHNDYLTFAGLLKQVPRR